MKKNSSFKGKLIIWIVGIVSIALVLEMTFIVFLVTKEFTQENEKYVLSAFIKTETELNNKINRISGDFSAIVTENTRTGIFNPDKSSYLSYTKDKIRISSFFEQYADYDIITLITGNTAFISTPKTFTIHEENSNWFLTPLYQQLETNGYGYGTAYLSEFTAYNYDVSGLQDQKIIYFTKKVTSGGAECLLVLGLRESIFREMFLHLELEGNNVYIVNREGTIISSDKPEDFQSQLPFFLSPEKNSLSFSQSIAGTKYQIIEYPLGYADWIIVNQYPIWLYMRNVIRISAIAFFICLCCLTAIVIAITISIRKLSSPLNELSLQFKDFSSADMTVPMPKKTQIAEFDLLNENFVKMANDLNELIALQKKEEDIKNQLRIQSLMAQINPHFIYNTLNTVKVMADVSGSENVSAMIQHINRYIAPAFRLSKNRWRYSEEYKFLEDYIYILEIRYGAKIEFRHEFDFSIDEYLLPRFLIQPLIENSINHGLLPQKILCVSISVKLWENDNVKIMVTDTGSGMTAETLKNIRLLLHSPLENAADSQNLHIGLLNIKQRLFVYYSENHTFEIESQPGQGTEITIIMPLK